MDPCMLTDNASQRARIVPGFRLNSNSPQCSASLTHLSDVEYVKARARCYLIWARWPPFSG